MAESWKGSSNPGCHSDDSYHEKLRIEPVYESFVCPLTKQVMKDPVTIENGKTFEREAIENWFKKCRGRGKRPTCPVSLKELNNTELNASIALRNTIEEWSQRNDAVQLEIASRSLAPECSESDVLQALNYIITFCKKCRLNKHVVRKLIPDTVVMLRNSSQKVRCKALETLRILAEEDDDNKVIISTGDTIRTIVKFLADNHSQERGEAVSLLYELSKSEGICEKIGGVNGAILILVAMSSSRSENVLSVDRAEKTLKNLEVHENNVRQMADNGRLGPLLTLLLEGSPETQLSMASYLGELALSNDVKVFVAQTAGSALIRFLRSADMHAREAALKSLYQISSYEASAKILVEVGMLPPLVKDLFTVGSNSVPMRLKELSATILANVVSLGANFEPIPLDHDYQTLVSEGIVVKLLHLISNSGPAIACKILQVLVGLTTSSSTVMNIISAIKSSGATISLIQFVETPQRDLRMASIKLLHNISPYMGQELADALRVTAGQLGMLTRIISEDNGISEEQAAAIGVLADLPNSDTGLTKRLLSEGTFNIVISKLVRMRQGETRGSRFVTPYLEGLVRVLSRLTYLLDDGPEIIALAQEHNITALFTDLLQMNGLDKVQMVSALALEKLSQHSSKLTRIPEIPEPGICGLIFPCFSQTTVVSGLCRVHHGICSMKESFCLLEGKAVDKLIACLDHANEKVVEAALAALCTLIDDGNDIEQGVMVLLESEGIPSILAVLLENQSETLRQRSVWAVERILRTEDIAYDISGDPKVGTALVDAFRHADYRTKQIAERALKHIDRLPKFSGIFTKLG